MRHLLYTLAMIGPLTLYSSPMRAEGIADVVSVSSDINWRPSYQPMGDVAEPMRMMGSAWGAVRVSPSDMVDLYVSGLARAWADWAVMGTSASSTPDYSGFLDLKDSYLKLSFPGVALEAGNLIIPWKVTRGVGLSDRVNPYDLRRGPNFSEASWARIPQWGARLKGSVDSVNMEAFGLVNYRAALGSGVASQQGGHQIGIYQTVGFDGPAQAHAFWETPSAGARVSGHFASIDFGVSALWGFDSVMTENLNFKRTVSFSADLTVPVSYFLLRAEGLAVPVMAGYGGRTAMMRTPTGLQTQSVDSYAAVLAFEGSYGDWINASIEIFDVMWLGLPAGARLWGIEPLNADISASRDMHRLALAIVADGSALEQSIGWRFRGEIGLLQPDFLGTVDIKYTFKNIGLYLGAFSDIFAGSAGSPGWSKRGATAFGLMVGHSN